MLHKLLLMQKLITGNFLGTNTELLSTNSLRITRVDYPENLSSDWHYHENAYFAFIQKGGSLERRKKENLQCYPGQLLFYNDQEAHQNEKYQRGSRNICLELQNEWFSKNQIDKKWMEGAFNIENSTIKSLFVRIIRETVFNDDCSRIAIEGLLLQVYAEMLRNKNNVLQLPAWLQIVQSFLHDNWNKKITIAEIAKLANVHPITLSKEFPRFFNCSFGEYLRKLRLERSLALLKKTHIPLDEIALNCAFYDSSHYINTFKSFYGMTPSGYRKILSK
jgi:AraC family transcriptional regulator